MDILASCMALTTLTMYLSTSVHVGAQQLSANNSLCETFVTPFGYPCDEFVVSTADGFLLGVQRMRSTDFNSEVARKPVFLLHGILSGGDSWVLNSPRYSLPFMLADAGYDVWIGNFRTTAYSYGHISLAKSEKDYWNWSLDELASQDMPSMLGFVFQATNLTLHFIGYSQGSQAAFAAFAQGQLISIVDKVVMIAPVAYLNSVTSPMALAGSYMFVDEMFMLGKIYEFNTKEDSGIQLVDLICASPDVNCYEDYITLFTGQNCCINTTRRHYYDTYETQSTAVKNLAHLAQMVRTGTFSKFDYGFIKNLEVYRSFLPPVYDLSAIPAMPLLLVHGSKDALSDPEDVQHLVEDVKFTPQQMILSNYAHLDFIIGLNASTDCYPQILSFLET